MDIPVDSKDLEPTIRCIQYHWLIIVSWI